MQFHSGNLTFSHHWHVFFCNNSSYCSWTYKEYFKTSPLPCVTLRFRLLCDPCCWEGGGQLLSSHFPELNRWTVRLQPVTDCLWWEEKPVRPTVSLCVWMTCILTVCKSMCVLLKKVFRHLLSLSAEECSAASWTHKVTVGHCRPLHTPHCQSQPQRQFTTSQDEKTLN